MKTVAAGLLAGLLLLEGALGEAAPTPYELAVLGLFHDPMAEIAYDRGFGVEGQFRYWPTRVIGLAAVAGAASWQVNEQSVFGWQRGLAIEMSSAGVATLMPLGGSLLIRPVDTGTVALTLEAGVRYVFIESQADVRVGMTDPLGRIHYRSSRVEFDDAVVGLAGVAFEGKLGEQLYLLGGVGFQFDLVKGDVSWLGQKRIENELESIYVQFGLCVRF